MTPEAALAPSVLIVDDEISVRDLMSRWLQTNGYAVSTAASADEALSSVQHTAPAVALCDIRMPGRDGLWLAQQIRQEAPETAVIMASGVQDVTSAVTSLRHGVVDYLTKPFGRERLRESVLRGVEWHRGAVEARRWREALQQDLVARQERLADALTSIPIDSEQALDAALAKMTAGDRAAYEHAYRVAALATTMGRAIGMADADVEILVRAALLHDIGKLAIPEPLLRKPAPLTPEELAVVRQFPVIGGQLLSSVPFLSPAADIVRDVYERFDTFGYPSGVDAGSVSIAARIIAVADAYDTMTRPRVFRDALQPSDALLELTRCAGTQFDATVVEVFKRLIGAA